MDTWEVYTLAQKIPRGKVTTYGELAKVVGGKRYARAVGRILNRNRNPQVPCHRVVYSNGKIGGFNWGKNQKTKMLNAEGIRIKEGRIINFKEVLFSFQKDFQVSR